ncbi:MAG TPA: hypothetical protein VK543_02705, partial [Puia sp.]|nr:hypothetical protein [Puia sp.]
KSGDYRNIPFSHAKSSQGGFSFVCGNNLGIIVGGDYAIPQKADSTAGVQLARNIFVSAEKSPAGFQSCVEHISNKVFLSTGTPGSNISTDGGKTWRKIDDASYNVCMKAKRGSLVFLAGDGGKIGVFKP